MEGSSAKLLYIFHSFQDDIEKLEVRSKVFLKLQQPKEYDTLIFVLFLKIRARYIIKDPLDLFSTLIPPSAIIHPAGRSYDLSSPIHTLGTRTERLSSAPANKLR